MEKSICGEYTKTRNCTVVEDESGINIDREPHALTHKGPMPRYSSITGKRAEQERTVNVSPVASTNTLHDRTHSLPPALTLMIVLSPKPSPHNQHMYISKENVSGSKKRDARQRQPMAVVWPQPFSRDRYDLHDRVTQAEMQSKNSGTSTSQTPCYAKETQRVSSGCSSGK